MAKFEVDADFSSQDRETILESLDSWESENTDLLDTIDKLEKMGEPPNDMEEDYRKGFGHFRQHMLGQKERAKKEKKSRRLTACRLKAKIIPEVQMMLQAQFRELSDEDLEALLDALDGWEQDSMNLIHMIENMKRVGDPPETMDPDYRKHLIQFRLHILSQEEKARRDKKVIRERATMLKAKVIMMQQNRGVDKVFDQAAEDAGKVKTEAKPTVGKMTAEDALAKGIITQEEYDNLKKKEQAKQPDPSEQ
jgi:hypothetical protein